MFSTLVFLPSGLWENSHFNFTLWVLLKSIFSLRSPQENLSWPALKSLISMCRVGMERFRKISPHRSWRHEPWVMSASNSFERNWIQIDSISIKTSMKKKAWVNENNARVSPHHESKSEETYKYSPMSECNTTKTIIQQPCTKLSHNPNINNKQKTNKVVKH